MHPEELRPLRGRGDRGGVAARFTGLGIGGLSEAANELLAGGADQEWNAKSVKQADIGEERKIVLKRLAEPEPRVGGNA